MAITNRTSEGIVSATQYYDIDDLTSTRGNVLKPSERRKGLEALGKIKLTNTTILSLELAVFVDSKFKGIK